MDGKLDLKIKKRDWRIKWKEVEYITFAYISRVNKYVHKYRVLFKGKTALKWPTIPSV